MRSSCSRRSGRSILCGCSPVRGRLCRPLAIIHAPLRLRLRVRKYWRGRVRCNSGHRPRHALRRRAGGSSRTLSCDCAGRASRCALSLSGSGIYCHGLGMRLAVRLWGRRRVRLGVCLRLRRGSRSGRALCRGGHLRYERWRRSRSRKCLTGGRRRCARLLRFASGGVVLATSFRPTSCALLQSHGRSFQQDLMPRPAVAPLRNDPVPLDFSFVLWPTFRLALFCQVP